MQMLLYSDTQNAVYESQLMVLRVLYDLLDDEVKSDLQVECLQVEQLG